MVSVLLEIRLRRREIFFLTRCSCEIPPSLNGCYVLDTVSLHLFKDNSHLPRL